MFANMKGNGAKNNIKKLVACNLANAPAKYYFLLPSIIYSGGFVFYYIWSFMCFTPSYSNCRINEIQVTHLASMTQSVGSVLTVTSNDRQTLWGSIDTSNGSGYLRC